MNSIKGIYHNGIVEPIIKPKIDIPTEVIIIFPDEAKRVTKIGGLYKNAKIDYEQIEKELKELSRKEDNSLRKKDIS
ncbi:MAG TPA: hypothetical protein P5120_12720 [Spirochaetota bacterium]|jgi:hypothetical protein|nr:hypothetical protein [Spirochaetota bacterium]HPF07387.1 hypothetical protein [Spirochaetota bacterium]HPJ43087.1 hypothetical protein [Spirochaetota bacterium]HPR38334.1 hypothetical protein [Spirochaetota bacterium]HRX48374.1 hypothetical protein [Spirochaetota bacterium]